MCVMYVCMYARDMYVCLHESFSEAGRSTYLPQTSAVSLVPNPVKTSQTQKCRMAAAQAKLQPVPKKLKEEIFVVKEEETGRVLECYAEAFAVVDDKKYMVGFPCDWCVSIGRPNKDGELEPLPLEGELMDDVFSTLQAMLEEDDVHLFRTPVTLTLSGDFMDDGEEDEDSDDDDDFDEEQEENTSTTALNDFEVIEEGDGELDAETDDSVSENTEDPVGTEITEENIDLIASFWHAGVEYSLVKHLDPILLVAQIPEGEEESRRFSLLSEAESAKINPIIEKLLLETPL